MSENLDIPDVTGLMPLLERQRTLYRQLSLLADRQKALVVEDDPQPLLALLAQRQQLVDELTAMNASLAPFRRRWTEVYGRLDDSGRRRASELLEEANTMLGSILQRDGRDTARLSARRQEMASRLATADSGSRAHAAYASAGAGARRTMTDAKA